MRTTRLVSHKRAIVLFSSTTLLALVSSQLVNRLIYLNLEEHQSWLVTPWLHFTHIRNHGGVFGIFQGQSTLFSLLSAVLLISLVAYLFTSKHVQQFEFTCFGFILGGGMSNILDRFIYGSVIDYFDIRGIPHWHYIFNLADVMIHIGLWTMVLISLGHSFRKKESGSESHQA